jgi:hypothetical protein
VFTTRYGLIFVYVAGSSVFEWFCVSVVGKVRFLIFPLFCPVGTTEFVSWT